MKKYLFIVLLVGFAWGQFKGEVTLKSGLTYIGKITEVDEFYVYLLADGAENAQGIPVTAISNSALDDGTLIVDNGRLKYHIKNNELITPEVSDLRIKQAMEDKSEPNNEIGPQSQKLNQLENRVKTIERKVKTTRYCIVILILILIGNDDIEFPQIF